jgi:PAS domain-containing protein
MTSSPDSSANRGIRTPRPRAGTRTRGSVDALQTRIAVNLQQLDGRQRDAHLARIIGEIPEAAGVDAAFLCLFNEDGTAIATVLGSCPGFASCSPDVLQGENLGDWPWLMQRFAEGRVIEVPDTLKVAERARPEFTRFAELHIGSLLVLGFSIQDTLAGYLAFANEQSIDAWDANLHLLICLFGASLTSGLDRLREKALLRDLTERHNLVSQTANDGIWDFDGQTKRLNLSPRWRRMLGYDVNDEDLMLDWYHLVHPDDMARVQARMREHL